MSSVGHALTRGALLACLGCNGWQHLAVEVSARSGAVRVLVRDERGGPVAGAAVTLADVVQSTDVEGATTFARVVEGGYLVDVSAPGFAFDALPLTVSFAAIGAQAEATLALRPVDYSDVRLLFAGDLSFDGGIADPNRDGIGADSLVALGADGTIDGGEELLAAVQPLFARFDLVTANLATVLGRGETPHPQKSDRALGPPGMASVLAWARVDVVNLGNDHAYDYLDDGVRETIEALDRAGVLHVGVGRDEAQASTPSLVSRLGIVIGQVSLSALVGRGVPPHLDALPLATAAQHKAGVIEALPGNVRDAVRQASLASDVVVAHLTAVPAWQLDTTGLVPLANDAVQAGASLVVGHGSRMIEPLWLGDGGALIVGGLGQLVFGGERPEARFGLLLEVLIRHRRLVAARLWPVALVEYRAEVATGALAARIVRHVASLSQAGVLLYPAQGRGAVALRPGAVQPVDVVHRATLTLEATDFAAATPVLSLFDGDQDSFAAALSASVASGAERSLSLQLGRELLWDGGFEDQTVHGPGLGAMAGWLVHAPDVGAEGDDVHSGRLALELVRKSGNLGDATARARGLYTLRSGHAYRFSACWRAEGEARATAALAIYPSRVLGARSTLSVAILRDVGSAWQCAAADYEPQVDELATPQIVLAPPERGTSRLFVDDVSLVEWDPRIDAAATQLAVPNDYEYLRVLSPDPKGSVVVQWVARRFVSL